MLCQFRKTRNNYVATSFILFSSFAASTVTSGYVVVRGRFGRNEKPAVSNEERIKKKPTFVPKVDLIVAIVFPSMQL